MGQRRGDVIAVANIRHCAPRPAPLPDGQVKFLDGQGHNVDPTVLAPALKGFFE